MKLLSTALVSVLVLLSMNPHASATSTDRVIKRIMTTGLVPIGYRPSSVPFSYLDNNGKPIGYSIDLCRGMVNALKRDLHRPDLKIKFVQVTPATRIPLTSNGTIVLSCGSAMNSTQRKKLVDFSPTTFYVRTGRFASLKKNRLNTVMNLKGKTIVSTAGSSEVKVAHELNAKYNLSMRIVTTQTQSAGLLMVSGGRASALMLDDVLLAGLVASSRNPDAWQISQDAHGAEVYGLIEPKGASTFNGYVNRALKAMMKSGEVTRLYDKWFTKPIPPNGINMKLPMPAQLKWALKHPTNCQFPLNYGSQLKAERCEKPETLPKSWVPIS